MNPLTPEELGAVRKLLAPREGGITATASEMKYRALAKRLLDTVDDQAAELRRHHLDFSRWEDMADKGARQIAKAKAWDQLYESASVKLKSEMAVLLGPQT